MNATSVLVCSGRGCSKPITRHAPVDRDGRPFCRRCHDKLPRFMRRKRTPRKADR